MFCKKKSIHTHLSNNASSKLSSLQSQLRWSVRKLIIWQNRAVLLKKKSKQKTKPNYKFRQYSKTCLLLASPCSHRSPWWTTNPQFWTVTGTLTLLKFNSVKETWRSVYSFSAMNILPPAEHLPSSLASQSRVTVYITCQMQPMDLLRKLDPMCTNIN